MVSWGLRVKLVSKFNGLNCQNVWVEKVIHYCYQLSPYMSLWERFVTLAPEERSVESNFPEQITQIHTSYLTPASFHHFICSWLQWLYWIETTEVLSGFYSTNYYPINGWNEWRNEMSVTMSLDEGAPALCNDINSEWCNIPTCTRSLILNQQALLFLTSGLLQLTLVAVVFSVWTTNLQKNDKWELGCSLTLGSVCSAQVFHYWTLANTSKTCQIKVHLEVCEGAFSDLTSFINEVDAVVKTWPSRLCI